jgi:hypothetical protein
MSFPNRFLFTSGFRDLRLINVCFYTHEGADDTTDNYQGEESDIVIACLTRSNSEGDIGFMSSPQRVNVLLSRARNALIMIGNPATFMNSRRGKDVWVPLMDKLKQGGHVYDGFPVRCEQHPDKAALLTKKSDFDSVCPDGGCSEPW